jgi:serine/threonine-protein kinase HipA
MRLGVFFGGRLVGRLVTPRDDRLAFEYEPEWLAAPDSFAVSRSLPLAHGLNATSAAHAYFANLLPEGPVREAVARRLGISPGNDAALLGILGRECAGALTIVEGDEAPAPESGHYEPLELSALARMARQRSVLAAGVGDHGVRLSLAGAHDKLAVRRDDEGRLWLPVGGAPSTHILKVPSRDFNHLPANEVLCLRVASALGLEAVTASLIQAEDVPVALTTRYDRIDYGTHVVRLHQEDFCQALGLPSTRKYEAEGGPSLRQAFELARAAVQDPLRAADRLLSWQITNVLLGNSDGHGKNLALAYTTQGAPRLAPFFDVVCTRAYTRVQRRLAMRVGGEADPGQIGRRHWEAMAAELGIGRRLVVERVEALAARVPAVVRDVAEAFEAELGPSPMLATVARHASRQCRRTLTLLR